MTEVLYVNQQDAKQFGQLVYIPNSPTAYCMYYLDCVDSVLDLDGLPDIKRLIDYKNYHLLNLDDKKILLAYCVLFNAEVLDQKVFFECNDQRLLRNNNTFYELGSTQIVAAADSEILIGGVRRQVMKLMLYKRQWILTYHLNALLNLKNEIEREENRIQFRSIEIPTITPSRTTSPPPKIERQ